MNWIEEHPYLTGGLVLAVIVLFLVLRGRSSASSTVVQAGPSDAVQAATLQAQVQQQSVQAAADVQNQQTGAALTAHLADVQAQLDAISAGKAVSLQSTISGQTTAEYQAAAGLQAVQSTNLAQSDIADTAVAGNVQIAGIQTQGAIDLAKVTGGTQVALAGIQAPVSLAAIQAALDATKSTNATSVDVANINANAATTINSTNVAGAEKIAETATVVPLAQTQAQVTLGSQGIAAELAALQSEIDARTAAVNQAYAALPHIGGSPNRVAVISATLNQPQIGTAAEGASAASAVAGSSVWSSFWSGLFGAGGKVATAALAP